MVVQYGDGETMSSILAGNCCCRCLTAKAISVMMAVVLSVGLMPLPAYAGDGLVAADPIVLSESSDRGSSTLEYDCADAGACEEMDNAGIGLLPTASPSAEGFLLAAASSPSVNLVPSDSTDNRRFNKSWPITATGSAETLTIGIVNQGSKKVKSYSWAQTNSSVVSLSSASGKSTTITSAGVEGYSVVTGKVTFTDGTSCSESAAYCVYTPLPGLDAYTTAKAPLTRGANPESEDLWLRGTAPIGQVCEVVGACGPKFRVAMPDDYVFTEKDKIPSNLAYVDKNKVHVEVDSVTISGVPDEAIGLGASVQLGVEVSPEIASDKRVVWTSSDDRIATVDETGLVVAVGVGSVEVIATAVDGGESDSVEIEVAIPGIEVSLDKEGPVKIGVNDSLCFVATVTADIPLDDYSVIWSSSDPSVAAVDKSGKVTGLARGTAAVRALSAYGAYASVTVAIMDASEEGMSLEEFLEQFPVLEEANNPSARSAGSVTGSGNKGTKPHANSVYLSWKKVKGAKRYEVQVKFRKKWREIYDVDWVKAPKHSCTVTEYWGGSDYRWIVIEPDETYEFRVLAYKEVPVKKKGKKTKKKKFVKLKTVRKITVTTSAGDPSDLTYDWYRYYFDNNRSDFGASNYYMNDDYKEKLIDACVSKWGSTRETAESIVNNSIKNSWGGSCFGMTTTTLLNGYKRLDVCKLVGESKNWKIGDIASSPKENNLLLSLINYFQCSYSLVFSSRIDADKVASMLIDEATGRTRPAGLRVFDFYWTERGDDGEPVKDENGRIKRHGHSILLYKHAGGVLPTRVTKGVHKGSDCWSFRTYDPNCSNTLSYGTHLYLYRDVNGAYTLEVGHPESYGQPLSTGDYPVLDNEFELSGNLDDFTLNAA